MARVLHASYSGYFPFCLEEFVPSPFVQNYYFNAYDLGVAMKTFWVYKKISFSGEFDVLDPNTLETRTEKFNMIIRSGAEKEHDLVCYPNWIVESVSSNLITLEQSPIAVGSPIWSGGDASPTPLIKDDKILLQYIASFYFKDTFGPQGIYLSPFIGGQYDPPPSTYILDDLLLYGEITAAQNFEAKVIEYWPYENESGEPIYNSKTGKLI